MVLIIFLNKQQSHFVMCFPGTWTSTMVVASSNNKNCPISFGNDGSTGVYGYVELKISSNQRNIFLKKFYLGNSKSYL